MPEAHIMAAALHSVRAHRIDTGVPATPAVPETVTVVREAPITIDVAGVDAYTILCTPADIEALVLGFLLSEGIIASAADIDTIRPCTTSPNTMRVKLLANLPGPIDQPRNLLIVSSCGGCGSEDLDRRLRDLPKVPDTLTITATLLRSASNSLRQSQVLFAACGGTHAAAIFDGEGRILASAEDTGRHNALDKAIGKCLQSGQDIAGRGAVLSGRVSMEMVAKCARAGIELMAAVSAPTSLALELAERCNITVCAFVRETRATVFGHGRRVLTLAG